MLAPHAPAIQSDRVEINSAHCARGTGTPALIIPTDARESGGRRPRARRDTRLFMHGLIFALALYNPALVENTP
jgi:hypothetical protein